MSVGWYEASMSATQPLTVIMNTLLGLISSSMILRDRGGGMMEGQDLGGSHMLCFGPENIFILLEILIGSRELSRKYDEILGVKHVMA